MIQFLPPLQCSVPHHQYICTVLHGENTETNTGGTQAAEHDRMEA